jgi:hypothetical protein
MVWSDQNNIMIPSLFIFDFITTAERHFMRCNSHLEVLLKKANEIYLLYLCVKCQNKLQVFPIADDL